MFKYSHEKMIFLAERSIISKIEYYCVYRERCVSEVKKKLRELGVFGTSAQAFIEYLHEENFLNEERFAQEYTHAKFAMKHWGRNKIRQHLKEKKVPVIFIDEALLTEIDEEEYLAKIESLIEKKWPTIKAKNDFEAKQKLYRYLHGKGYEMELVRKVLARMRL